jgi:hypothetical protein
MVDADSPQVDELVSGAVDTHMHTGPDAFPRQDTHFSAARKARDNDMRAIAIKSHHFETGARAQMATQETGFEVVGGVTLNEWVGGMNPRTVDGAAAYGCTIVWLPSITATHHLLTGEIPHLESETPREDGTPGISLFDENDELTDETLAVIDRIAAHDMVPGLSHVSPAEAIAFVDAASDRGVDEFLVQHPNVDFLDYSLEEMRTITDLGATLEFHYICTTELLDECATIQDYIDGIDAVGPENVVMATDGGAADNPPAMEMFRMFIADMLEAGVDAEDIRTMTTQNPKRVLGLD